MNQALMQNWQQNPFYKQGQGWGAGGYQVMPNWQNKYNCYIPPIKFTVHCKKCGGCGVYNRGGMSVPCTVCYKRQGICDKCYGGGINFKNGKPCKKCQGGRWQRKQNRKSSSSSNSY